MTSIAPSVEPVTSRRSAAFQPATFNDADNSVEVVWTTGAAVTRFDFLTGEYYDESLAVDAKSVRIGRLNDGGPVLVDHDARTASLAGSVVPGSVKLANGQGSARIRLSDTPDMADTVAKVKAGHLRTVSVAYQVNTYELRRGKDGERDQMLATDWEPLEISLTPVPADAGAVIRARSADMPEIVEVDDAPRGRERGKVLRAVTADRIRDMCSRTDDLSRAFERELIDEHADEPLTEREVRNRINTELAKVRAVPAINARANSHGNDGDVLPARIEDALFARLSGTAPSERAREFMGASMVDMARGLLEARGERGARWLAPGQIMQRYGAHTTSDFPNLLASAGGRYLQQLYSASPSPLKALARKRLVPDFRQINALAMLPFGILRPVGENAEFKRVTIAEGLNGYKLATFGEIFAITRQAFINDDLGYFSSLAEQFARAANETEASQLAGLITANGPTMGDNQPLYSTAHGNLSATTDAITVTSLSAARQAMRAQKNVDGTPANVVPRYLVVGPAKETEAEQILAALSAVNAPSAVNPFSGKLELVVDPRITGLSWRLFADPGAWPVLEYANLQGQEGLFTDTRVGFDVDGFEFKARLDFGAGAVDYRGTYKNAGA